MKFCPNCGRKVNDQAQFCPNCGAKLPDVNRTNQPQSSTMNNAPVKYRNHHGKLLLALVVIILLLIGGYKVKTEYFTQARFLSWQLPHYTWTLGEQHHPGDYEYDVFNDKYDLGSVANDDDDGIKDVNSLSTNGSLNSKNRKGLKKVVNEASSKDRHDHSYKVVNDKIEFGDKTELVNVSKKDGKYLFQFKSSNGSRFSAYLKKYKKISPIK